MLNNKLQKTNFLLYSSGDEKIFVDVYFKDENIWMTQNLMSQLFKVGQPAIAKHLKNIFESGELEENSVYSILEITAKYN